MTKCSKLNFAYNQIETTGVVSKELHWTVGLSNGATMVGREMVGRGAGGAVEIN